MDKKALQQKLEAQLKEWKADIDKLKAQAEGKSADAKISYQKKIKELESKVKETQDQLEAIKEGGAEKLEDTKKDLEKGAKDLKDKFKKPFS